MKKAVNAALRDWMNHEEGIAFFRIPLKAAHVGMLAAVLLEHPDHKFEIHEAWLGVFKA